MTGIYGHLAAKGCKEYMDMNISLVNLQLKKGKIYGHEKRM
jgi:hypothetical protein